MTANIERAMECVLATEKAYRGHDLDVRKGDLERWLQALAYSGRLRPPASFESRSRPLGNTHPSSRYYYSRHEKGASGPYISTSVHTNHESDSPPLCTIDIDPSQTGGYGFISMKLEVTDPRWLREAAAVLLDSADRLKSQQNAYQTRKES